MRALTPNGTAKGAVVAMPKRTRFANTRSGFDYLIVGAGFAGSVLAERLATELDKRVLLIDRRPHIAGNAYDHYNDAGLLIHRYGPHIFHTNSTQVVNYLSRFTKWRPYEHKVLAHVDEQLVPIPINLTTLVKLYGIEPTPEAAEAFLASRAEPVAQIRTSEDEASRDSTPGAGLASRDPGMLGEPLPGGGSRPRSIASRWSPITLSGR